MLCWRRSLENVVGFLLNHSIALSLALSMVGICSCVDMAAPLAPQEPLVPTLENNSKKPAASDQNRATSSAERVQKELKSAEESSQNVQAISGTSQLFELVPMVAHEPKLVQGATHAKPLELKLTAHKRNKVTDDDEWFAKNHLVKPVTFNAEPDLSHDDSACGKKLLQLPSLAVERAIMDGSHVIYLLTVKSMRLATKVAIFKLSDCSLVRLLDFNSWVVTEGTGLIDFELRWATLRDGILYIAQNHLSYASTSGGYNAFVSAVELDSLNFLWRSQPLVANAQNFVLTDDLIICGYGYSKESDFLFQLDRKTGNVLSKIPVASGPEYIVRQGRKLYVRTYHTDYEFTITE